MIGDLPVEKIEVADVRAILKAIWKDKPETASSVRGRIEAVIRAARSDDDSLWANPADWERHKDHFAKRPKPHHHHPALPYQDVPAFMTRLRGKQGIAARAGGHHSDGVAHERGARRHVRRIRLRRQGPPERMKGREEGDAVFRVPICDRVIAIVKELATTKVSKYVFPGLKPDEPLSNMAMLMLLRDIRPGRTVHGFRSSFRDWAKEQARTPDHDPSGTGSVREYALSHMPKDKVKRAYLRADLLEKRRPLMEELAKYCETSAKKKPARGADAADAAALTVVPGETAE